MGGNICEILEITHRAYVDDCLIRKVTKSLMACTTQ